MMEVRTVDIVVVGFGGAGACAAIEAHDAGACVQILEKAPEGGGNTRESGGTIRQINDWRLAVEHYKAVTQGTTPTDILEAFAAGVGPLLEWLRETVGATLVEAALLDGFPRMPVGSSFPALPGAEALGARLRVAPGEPGESGGSALWTSLKAAVERRGIDVRYNAPVRRLVRNGSDSRITGVVFEDRDNEVTVRASRGVVLTCGGFASNRDMHRNFIGGVDFHAFGPPGRNTGDGVSMAMEAGADLWHMYALAGPFGYKFPEYEAAFAHLMPSAGYIYVDRDAERFINEAEIEYHACALTALAFDPLRGRYPRIPAYVIFDEIARQAGPIAFSGAGWNRRFPWSADNTAEIERGWIKKADDLESLARLLDLAPGKLAATVAHYNGACDLGHDGLFGRRAEYLTSLAVPPFYGVAIWPCLLNTQGGPRRSAAAEILSVRGAAIPGLYGAGELGSIWGMLYPGAGNLTEALIFGRIAGRNAAGCGA